MQLSRSLYIDCVFRKSCNKPLQSVFDGLFVFTGASVPRNHIAQTIKLSGYGGRIALRVICMIFGPQEKEINHFLIVCATRIIRLLTNIPRHDCAIRIGLGPITKKLDVGWPSVILSKIHKISRIDPGQGSHVFIAEKLNSWQLLL